jgi:hypothetical protein
LILGKARRLKDMLGIREFFVALAICAGTSGTSLAQACQPGDREQSTWNRALADNRLEAFASYLRQFPTGCFRSLALSKFEEKRKASPGVVMLVKYTGDQSWTWGNLGQLFERDDRAFIEQVQINQINSPRQIHLEYACYAVGHGQSAWLYGGKPCPDANAPMQRIAVRLRGDLKDFYNLTVYCRTVAFPQQEWTTYLVGDEEWCGPKRSGPASLP